MTKRLLFITPIFPKNAAEDSVVPFVFQFTKSIVTEKNVAVDVISLMYPFSSKKYEIDGITVYPIGSKFRSFLGQLPYFFIAIVRGYRIFKQNKYDGILCFWYRESSLIGKILSYLTSKKQVVWMLGQDINKDNKYISLLKITDKNLVMASSQQRNLFFENHKIKVDKIGNVAVTRSLFPNLNRGERAIDILGVGNLGALKNYSLFIEIISQLENKNCTAVIIGDGEEMEMLKKKKVAFGLENRITFLGSKSHQEVLEYMNNAKLFLHTSKSEGGATVIQEALFSGCKIISTIEMESYTDTNNFYFNKDKQELINHLNLLFRTALEHQRVENFKMEDSVKLIYDAFYKD